MDTKEIYNEVNKRYGSINQSTNGQYEQTVAKAFGYTSEELASVPEGANLGLSCGNPLALAKLKDGETIIDLGSGAGFDVFAAAKKVGVSGKAIGVDMNKNMIDKANGIKSKGDFENVEFVEGAITSIPLPDNTADCIISNCVINLVPETEKQLVFNEMYRVLKSGGRVAVSDILARKELTDDLKKNMSLYVGCISGASQVNQYEEYLQKAGFNDLLIVDSKNDLNVYHTAVSDDSSCCGPVAPAGCGQSKAGCGQASLPQENTLGSESKKLVASLENLDFNEWAGSFQIYAIKPTTK
ncbi:hypothetical protein HYFRA_00007148 [Hymenoscyphus fraxineus]|uniref:Arsenite methyltransferase n=1 Tax=Hymenoscyphus fraxineus TaxID=746836 RepID=A0A9N9PU17_9HELO|nr:hypothetical protein HYFRA_00007148 [Hymenoscyphus fraxineus]